MSASYVALGDSYAAGVGGGASTGSCWRSRDGYPVLVANALGVDVAYAACIGATVGMVREHQLAAVGEDADYVSITVGGNDIGFVPVLITAAEPSWMSNSDTAIDVALELLRHDLPGQLDTLYAELRALAPRATVVATGYPRLFNGKDCNLATFFAAEEMDRLNAAADELDQTIRSSAERAGIGFAEVAPDFIGHAMCDDEEWINGVSWPLEGSFHPSHAGHAAYARIVAAAFGGVAEPTGRTVVIVEGPPTPSATPTFSLPDLLSDRSMTGARGHGLDPDEVAALARDPSMSAMNRLHEIDREVCDRR